ncbi:MULTISPECIES: hypothetical protein [Pseudonocardia]|uniref:PIN domain-containing protein n=2 Tax=Pseudonocardia TaxID=1847 RepID=A0A1Y2MP67_PSEAH|nr:MULTISPECIES: hypothetical protein [Pseudonocardia]OSY36931.1 hypothetical protein BG845_05014 [Pseudonocardia autotrophica]TDN75614.1 hypothetical protein C8E95_4792 [Pseudonocardia autotrophica]BBF99585.1 hypothetical protein Pdca_07950 [Pseudonocardia autotrophica]GEC28604.1 hypothetical protein PSA01_56330 [Pseudonocardia saturnea]
MTPHRPIIDAGPALNFFSINRERLLLGTLGRLSAPETVRDEVLRKARADPRFHAAAAVWSRVVPNWMEILPDAVTPRLNAVVSRLSGLPLERRRLRAGDLGETMVIAHAVVAAERGAVVTVVIDDGVGARMADAERRRLERLRLQGLPVGALLLVNTVTILELAAGGPYLRDRHEMRSVYDRLRGCDDGLVPIERTPLLAERLWRPDTG